MYILKIGKIQNLMSTISVPVLWDQDNNFLNNAQYVVDTSSVVVRIVSKPAKPYPPAQQNQTFISCIKLKTPNFQTLYVNLSLAQYQALIALQTPYQHTYVFKGTHVDLTQMGIVKIGTTDAYFGKFTPVSVRITYTSGFGTITASGRLNLGFTPDAYSDILNNVTPTGSPKTDATIFFTVVNGAGVIPSSTDIYLNVTQAIAFSGPGAAIADVYVQGWYELLNNQ